MLTSGTGSKINLGPNPKMNDPSFSHLVFSWLANCYTHTRIPTGSTFAHLSACPDFHLNFQAKKDRVEKRRPIQFQTLIRSFSFLFPLISASITTNAFWVYLLQVTGSGKNVEGQTDDGSLSWAKKEERGKKLTEHKIQNCTFLIPFSFALSDVWLHRYIRFDFPSFSCWEEDCRRSICQSFSSFHSLFARSQF